MPDEVAYSMIAHSAPCAKIWGVGGHCVFQGRCEWQDFVLYLDRGGRVFGKIFRLGCDESHRFALKVEFLREGLGHAPGSGRRIRLRSILISKDGSHTSHLFSGGSIDAPDPGMRMRRGEELH